MMNSVMIVVKGKTVYIHLGEILKEGKLNIINTQGAIILKENITNSHYEVITLDQPEGKYGGRQTPHTVSLLFSRSEIAEVRSCDGRHEGKPGPPPRAGSVGRGTHECLGLRYVRAKTFCGAERLSPGRRTLRIPAGGGTGTNNHQSASALETRHSGTIA